MKRWWWLGSVLGLLLGALVLGVRHDLAVLTRPLLAWYADLGGPLIQPPVRSGEVVLAAPVGGALYAFDARSGRKLWTFAPEAGLWERSLAADERLAYIAARDGTLYALDLHNGTLRWQHSVAPYEPVFPMLVDHDALFVASKAPDPLTPDSRARLFVLGTDGSPVAQFVGNAYAYQRPFVTEEMIFLAGSYFGPHPVDEGGWMRLYALERSTLRKRWSISAQDGFVKSLYAHGGTVAYIAYRDHVVALDAASGQVRWTRDTGNWVPAFVGFDDRLLFGAANTQVHLWDLQTGQTVWTYDIGGGSFNYVLHTPVVLPRQVLLLTQRGDLVALERTTGRARWMLSTGRMARTGLTAAPWGMLFFGDEQGMLWAYTFTP